MRCDASLSIGSGHIIRCRTLARELCRRGSEVIFLCRRQPGDLINLLEKEFLVFSLPEQPLVDCDGLEGRDLYSAWLGCDQEQDASDCLQVLAESGVKSASWLVVDHYGLDVSWEQQLIIGLSDCEEVPKLLVIDDLADRAHQSDVLLDQNFYGEVTDQRYQGLVPIQCLQLLGPHYALLGPEYAQLHPLVPPRTELKRLLVFLGGVDSSNVTGRVLKALMDPVLADLAVDVVLGLHSPNRHDVVKLVAQMPNVTLHEPLPSLAGLISRADIAIGAGGATTWERSCLGLESFVVAIAANQLPVAKALDQFGHLHFLGDDKSVSTELIRSALLSVVAKQKTRKPASVLTDGWGASRLATAMLGCRFAIQLRPPIPADQTLFLRFANDLQTRASNSLLGASALADHQRFLQLGLVTPNRHILIVNTADGCSIGQLFLDRQLISGHDDLYEARLSFLLDRCVYGHHVESELVRLAFQELEKHWAPCNDGLADLDSGNPSSNHCFLRMEANCESVYGPLLISDCDSLAMMPCNITLLSDRDSWLNAYLPDLITLLWGRGHAVRWIHTPAALCAGDVCLMLSCGRLLNPEQLALNQHNLVVHGSALPLGQGWSPMTWQILEGASVIPITLFEAVPELDAGPIYLQEQIQLEGHELADEWRVLLAQATIKLCLTWFDRYQEVLNHAQPQDGDGSQYRRRRPADSQLDPEQSLAEQFNLLRVVDNKSYPAFFRWRNSRYDLFIRRS